MYVSGQRKTNIKADLNRTIRKGEKDARTSQIWKEGKQLL